MAEPLSQLDFSQEAYDAQPVMPTRQPERALHALPDGVELTVEEWRAWWGNYIPHVGGKPLETVEDLAWWHSLPGWRKDLYRIPQAAAPEERAGWLKALGLERVVSYAGKSALDTL